jgi:transmembrane sensor
MNDEIDLILLDRYRAGECTAAERARVEWWAAADSSRAALLAWMRSLEAAAVELPDPWDAQELWTGVRERLVAPVSPAVLREQPRRLVSLTIRRQPAWPSRLLRVAAVVGMVAAGAALWRAGDRTVARGAETTAFRTVSTGFGERAVISLADGSQVIVDAGSTLRIPHDFDRASRDVQLDGRAYFEVVSDSARPFRVYSGNAVTRVLGTKFGVQAYRAESAVTVAVREGRVALATVRDSAMGTAGGVVLAGGDLATLDASGQLSVDRDGLAERHLAWTTGRLEFLNTPLGKVRLELARRYGLEILPNDTRVDSLLWTASLQNESVDEVLQMLAESLELGIERHGDRVVLRLLSSKGLSR